MNLQENIRRILREQEEELNTDYAVIEIIKPLAYMNPKYYYQTVPYFKTLEDRISVRKNASDYKSISTKNIKVLKIFHQDNKQEMMEYLERLRADIY